MSRATDNAAIAIATNLVRALMVRAGVNKIEIPFAEFKDAQKSYSLFTDKQEPGDTDPVMRVYLFPSLEELDDYVAKHDRRDGPGVEDFRTP
jgi:hypothetical protein